jgi:zinc and cadmium transporter
VSETLLLLCGYSAALVLSSLAGGSLPQRLEMSHTRTQMVMSLVSGLMLGIAFFHLLPHALQALPGPGSSGMQTVMAWALLGLVAMLLLLRLFHFHQPDYHPVEDCGHGHDHAPETAALQVHTDVRTGWRGVLSGLALHTVIDGVALAAAVLGELHVHGDALPGFGVFLAILLHKPLDAMSISALMRAGRAQVMQMRLANLLFALLCPAGALLFWLYAGSTDVMGGMMIAAALAFSGGAFICIALSDLLPEVQFHSHDRLKLSAAFLSGILLAVLLGTAEEELQHPAAGVPHAHTQSPG